MAEEGTIEAIDARDYELLARVRRAIQSMEIPGTEHWNYDNLLRAFDKVIAASQSRQWKEIESAPKDGRRFLAGVEGSDDVAICSRHDPGGAARNPKHHYECWLVDFKDEHQPTHWYDFGNGRPLPPPPAQGGAGFITAGGPSDAAGALGLIKVQNTSSSPGEKK